MKNKHKKITELSSEAILLCAESVRIRMDKELAKDELDYHAMYELTEILNRLASILGRM